MDLPADGRKRVVIEHVTPQVDGGQFPIKRTVGEEIRVEADAFADGHDEIRVVVRYGHERDATWTCLPMRSLGNDRWVAEFTVQHTGRYRYRVEGWIDPFRSWRRDLIKRLDAAQDVRVDVQMGLRMLHEAAVHAQGNDVAILRGLCEQMTQATPSFLRELATSSQVLDCIDRWLPPEFVTKLDRELVVWVEPERARFSTWYEMFPRSAAPLPAQHGTLRDVINRLPYVAEMGFDVLYLPPIHPIGQAFRKGRNNSVSAEPGDVGSPWAIGGDSGGHKAILPELGTFEDFDALVAAAGKHGIQVALDIAFQCSPDHPYVRDHDDWFRKRPDGSIQYAENPPKKYQDIYPLWFESPQWRSLWDELKSVFEFWIDRNVRIFRVDNPHTKAFPFWEWCIGALKEQHPDLIFLSEAFTRPKVMYRLAKLGFTQSYTYFAWRHSRHELTEYLSEITSGELAEFFRPNLWPNTPDILTAELQEQGRPAFIRRLVLAATMSASYGIYGPPYEHMWSAPAKPGSEEYLNSEKYEIHQHDLSRPDSLKGLIGRLNRIRRDNVALQFNRSLQFHPVDNEQLLCYSKRSADGTNVIVVLVNLDSRYTQSGFVQLPQELLGLDEHEPYQMHDLLTDSRFMWSGRRNYVELNPHQLPAHVFRVRRRIKSGSEREYFE